jgi:hypothetical protein
MKSGHLVADSDRANGARRTHFKGKREALHGPQSRAGDGKVSSSSILVRFRMPLQPEPYSWQQFDQTLANTMLLDLALEFHRLAQEDLQQIRYQNIGNENSISVPSQRLEMQLLRSDEWAGRSYQVYCDVWRSQHKDLYPQFYRDVCQQAIRTMISVRVGSVKAELNREEILTRSHNDGWLNAATQSFSQKMELLFGKWQRAAEIDAKSIEYMLAAAPDRAALNSVGGELVHARTQLRIFDAKIATIDMRIAGWERALSATRLRETDAYRIKTIEQRLTRCNADKKELETRQHHWQVSVNAALGRSAEFREVNKPDPSGSMSRLEGRRGVRDQGQGEANSGLEQKLEKRATLKYTSARKRAIALLLSLDPEASDLRICRQLDADGAVELPASWRTGDNRLFELAYKNPRHRRKIEITISKVRTDMRRRGLRP